MVRACLSLVQKFSSRRAVYCLLWPGGEVLRVDPCRTQSCHALSLRSTHYTESADRAVATGATLPDTHPRLFAAGRARGTLRQLATGPGSQLSRASRLSGEDARVEYHGRPGRRDGGSESIRLLSRALRTTIPVRVRAGRAARVGALPGARSADTAVLRLSRIDRPQEHELDRLARRSQHAAVARRPL